MVQKPVPAVRTKRVFTEEFEIGAVRLVSVEGDTIAAAAKSVGVGEPSLRKWHARLAPPPVPCGEDASVAELRAENDRLRRELRRAEMEREILKFTQDASRIRKGHSPEITSMLRQLALMILQRDTRLSGSLRCKRKPAGWNNDALETLLTHFQAN